MAKTIASNGTINLALRMLQLLFAIIVMGTDGYAINVYRGHTVYNQTQFGNYYDYEGVPSAWGFLMFCAAWTFLAVIFHFVAAIHFADKAWMSYTCVGVEAIALLSWLAGFIAVAVNVGSSTCPSEEHGCGAIKAATVFGAFAWLLFVVTTALTVKLVFGEIRQRRVSRPWTHMVGPADTKITSLATPEDKRSVQYMMKT